MPHPTTRRVAPLAALLALALPAAARAQSSVPDLPPTPTVARVVYNGNQSEKSQSNWYDPTTSVSVTDPAGHYSASSLVSRPEARLSLYVDSDRTEWTNYSASASAGIGDVVRLQNTTAQTRTQTFNFYTHGLFDATAHPQAGWQYQFSYSVSAWLGPAGGWSQVWSSGRYDGYDITKGDLFELKQINSATVAVAPGATVFFGVIASVWTTAYAGGIADMSQTSRIFAEPTPGIVLSSEHGFLSRQRIPVWAGGPQVVTPEPATLLLVAPALLGVAAVVRRRRAPVSS